MIGILKDSLAKVFLKNERLNNYYRKKGVKIGKNVRFLGKISFGSEPYLIEIGNDCTFSGNVSFMNHDGGVSVINNLYGVKVDKIKPIKIGNNCFVGKNASILPGVVIGDNCIIGYGAVVTKSIKSGEIWGGVPARFICTVEDYFKKNEKNFHETVSMSYKEKRNYYEDLFNIGL